MFYNSVLEISYLRQQVSFIVQSENAYYQLVNAQLQGIPSHRVTSLGLVALTGILPLLYSKQFTH